MKFKGQNSSETAESKGIVVGYGAAKKRRLPIIFPKFLSRKILIVLVILILAVTAGVVVYFLTRGPKLDLAPGRSVEDAQLLLASDAAQTGDLDKAKKQADAIIEGLNDNDKKAEFLKKKGNICATYNDFECAISSYEEADKLVGEDASSAEQKGMFAERAKQYDRAKAFYERGIELANQLPSPQKENALETLELGLARITSGGTAQ